MILQLAFVLTAIIIGARLGGIGLGVMGGIGLAILTFVFGLQPTAPPIDVMLMIAAVISAAACMQAAGGLDYMVKLAEHLLRKNPSHVTLLSPLVTYLFTFVAGTGHVAYSVLPVIAEVATETKIRPERPLGIAVIASQQDRKPDFCSHSCFTRTIGRFRHHSVRYSQDYDSRYHYRCFGRCVVFYESGQKPVRRSRIPEASERRAFQRQENKNQGCQEQTFSYDFCYHLHVGYCLHRTFRLF